MDLSLPELRVLRRSWEGYADAATTREVEVCGARIGGPRPVLVAGPCAVESYEQAIAVARVVRDAGVRLMRGGVYKPRTNPHEFQGLGDEGLAILRAVREETGLGIVTEVMDPRLVERVAACADMLQVGSRSMQNFPLLTEVGRAGVPVLLKRAWSATLEEWLCAAEYVAKEGNDRIVLCERGIRGSCHWSYARNLLDLNVLEPLRQATPLPVLVDPCHSTGRWQLAAALGEAALAAGAHGLLVEVVSSEEARRHLRSDAQQGVPPEVLRRLAATCGSAAERAHPHGPGVRT